MKLIETFSEFILNETLKTHDINLSVNDIENELSLMRYNFSINKNKNKIELTLHGFRFIQNPFIALQHINSLIIDRHGWFPSEMKLVGWLGDKNKLSYNEQYLFDKIQYLETVTIIYEAKYDKIKNIPKLAYHLSIQEYENSILNKGLIPKSKSKISKHLDRIYFCEYVKDCYNLIPQMKADYMVKMKPKSEINLKWIIYEVDLSNINMIFYEDPNHNKGFYCVNNIPKDRIKIYDKE